MWFGGALLFRGQLACLSCQKPVLFSQRDLIRETCNLVLQDYAAKQRMWNCNSHFPSSLQDGVSRPKDIDSMAKYLSTENLGWLGRKEQSKPPAS